MGEFLSSTNKEKHSGDGENSFVNKNKIIIYFNYLFSWDLALVICKDGEKDKKMLI